MGRANALSAVVLLSSAACAGQPAPVPRPPPPDVAAPAPPAPTASAAPSASVPPPAAGLERRTLELGNKPGEGLAVALDVPAEWGTDHTSGMGTPEVRLCRDG